MVSSMCPSGQFPSVEAMDHTTHDDHGLDQRTARKRLLAGLPLTDGRWQLAGISTAVLEGGEGPPLVLLHGPGEFAAGWLPVFRQLVRTHRVIAPDLPGHGASLLPDTGLDAARLLDWLDELIKQTCASPPVLVGRVVGGALAARFAAEHSGRLAHLVLVDSMGLAPFEPTPRFARALHRFFAGPTETSYDRFMEFCAFDLDRVRERLGTRWQPWAAYAVELAATPAAQAAVGAMLGHFAAPLPPEQLARIDVPTTLIWGRDDLALPLAAAKAARDRYGWPLHVIPDAGDDPALDQPDAFLTALRSALDAPTPAWAGGRI